MSNGLVHLTKKIGRMISRIDYPMVLFQQFFARILTDGTELIVDIGDGAVRIGHRYNSGLIQGSDNLLSKRVTWPVCLICGSNHPPENPRRPASRLISAFSGCFVEGLDGMCVFDSVYRIAQSSTIELTHSSSKGNTKSHLV